MNTEQKKEIFAVLVEAGGQKEASADFAGARLDYLSAVDLFPRSTKALMLLAKLEAHLGLHARAVGYIRNALEIKSDAPAWWHIRLGQSLAELGDIPSAIESYENAIGIDECQQGWRAGLDELRRQAQSGNGGRLGQTSAAFYDDLYAASPTYRQVGEDTIYAPMWACMCELMEKRNVKSIVDIGCGPGQFAAFVLKRRIMKYLGIDISSVAINQAKMRMPTGDFRAGDIFAIGLPKGKFDAVVCTEVLEHIDRDIDLIKLFPTSTFAMCSVPSFHSFGHLRTFADEKSVAERYGRFFSDFTVQGFALPSAQRLYLFHGTVI